MAELLTQQLDVNVELMELERPVASPFFEDYLFNVFTDLSALNAEIGVITQAPNAYTRDAAIVEDRTLLASASATATNNNNVLAALIADLQAAGIIS